MNTEQEVRSLYQTLKNAEEEYGQALYEYEEEYGSEAREKLEEELVSR